MSIEYIRYRIDTDRQHSFLAAYKAAVKPLAMSTCCLGYELTQCEEEPQRFILRIEWTSTEDHMQKFRQSDQFKEFLPHIRPFIEDIEEMQHYLPTEVVS